MFRVVVSYILLASSALATLLGVPTVPFTGKGSHLDLKDVKTIVVDTAHGSAKDRNGQTLIPPTLDEFAKTFADDWSNIVGNKVSLKHETTGSHGAVFLTLGNHTEFKDAAGRWTSEAYETELVHPTVAPPILLLITPYTPQLAVIILFYIGFRRPCPSIPIFDNVNNRSEGLFVPFRLDGPFAYW